MKKSGRKIIIAVIIFIILAAAVAAVYFFIGKDKGSGENYINMEEPTLPTVSMIYNESKVNTLHGYINQMELGSMRGTITPVENRTLPICITKGSDKVTNISYQVRSLDGTELIEDTIIKNWQEADGEINAEIRLSSLIEENVEYTLDFVISTESHPEIHYYSRIFYSTDMYANNLLSYAIKFSDATFDKEEAKNIVIEQMKSGGSSENGDFSYVDLYSKFNTITWGDLAPSRIGTTQISITELSQTQISLTLSYRVAVGENKETTYKIKEFFCLRRRPESEKIYILDYNRTMDQELNVESSITSNGSINLGITSEELSAIESSNEKYGVFSYGNTLWWVDLKENVIKPLFQFKGESIDLRSDYDQHEIKVIKVSDGGNVDFIVYGYMNRGEHEGSVGASFYRYRQDEDSLEELFYISSKVSYPVFQMDIGQLAYVNDQGIGYFLYGSGIYKVDLTLGETVQITDQINDGTYRISPNGDYIAWEEGEESLMPSEIKILNMRTGVLSHIVAEDGEYVRVLGFINRTPKESDESTKNSTSQLKESSVAVESNDSEVSYATDIVYGIGRSSDIGVDSNGSRIYPWYTVEIADSDLNVENHYEANGIYITDASVGDSKVNMKRVMKQGEIYVTTENDMLLLNQPDEEMNKVKFQTTTSDERKLEHVMVFSKKIGQDVSVSKKAPKILQKDTFIVQLDSNGLSEDSYYVYAYGTMMFKESQLQKAIQEAFDRTGVVVRSNQTYVWTKGTRALYKILQPPTKTATTSEESLATSLEILLESGGGDSLGLEQDLESGVSIDEIMRNRFGSRGVNLSGCEISQTLYYINQGNPVMAVTGGNSAVLIIGYDSNNATIYDPATGQTVKMSMDQANETFASMGNIFYSYTN